jgi:hypothetical protein
MKRAFWIAMFFTVGLVIGTFFLGKEVIFSNTDYHIPEEYKIEIIEHNQRYILVNLYDEEGYKVDEYVVPVKQIQRIIKERILTDGFYNVHPWYTALYVLCSLAILAYFIQWCVSVDCCKPYNRQTNWESLCYGLCDKRCNLYNAIDTYDLTPHKQRFNLFWGY